jgi:hypothetical protein
VYFIVPNEEQRVACDQALRRHPDLTVLRRRSGRGRGGEGHRFVV